MTRSIPPSMANLLQELELEQPTLVMSEQLERLVTRFGLQTPTKLVAARLRERGWLLPTGCRGVWEFAPAAVAGAHSRNDPVTPLRAFLIQRPGVRCGLTFQAAAWAYGLADRAPLRLEVAVAKGALAHQLPSALAGSAFDPRLEFRSLRGVPVLAAESILVHMAARPSAVRSWTSALEWFPELAQILTGESLVTELDKRSAAVRSRTGYLLQGLRPDLADVIRDLAPQNGMKGSKTWFGPRGKLLHHDAAWQIADTMLPFDPRTLRIATSLR